MQENAEVTMRTFILVAGSIFTLIALAQVARLVFAVPFEVAGISIPVWASAFPLLIAGSLAVWAFRLVGSAPPGHPKS